MIRTPGKKEPNIKNRSSKHLHFLTRSGLKMMNEWHKKCGIPEYKEPYSKKKDDKKVTKETTKDA